MVEWYLQGNTSPIATLSTTNFTWTEFSSYLEGNALHSYKSSQLMLYGEIIAVCSEKRTKHITLFCGQNV